MSSIHGEMRSSRLTPGSQKIDGITRKLYCIGLGPGDPELVTVKARRLLVASKVIFIPTVGTDTTKFNLSIVRSIVSRPRGRIVEIMFPLISDKSQVEAANRENAERIAGLIPSSGICTYVTHGDPTIYNRFRRIMGILESEHGIDVELVPGVSSITACPAARGMVIAEEDESIMITTPDNLDAIRRSVNKIETIVLLKLSGNLDSVVSSLKESGLSGDVQMLFAKRCTTKGESYTSISLADWRPDLAEDDYYSMVIVRQKVAN